MEWGYKKIKLDLKENERANLQKANLQKANLEDANLQGADLQGANLQGTNLKDIKLTKDQAKEIAIRLLNGEFE